VVERKRSHRRRLGRSWVMGGNGPEK
jgi:hypothetical protein